MTNKPRILVIEDEEGLLITLQDRLEMEGYEVITAENGNAGYALALEKQPDLIILDLMLPGKSGLDICKDLRQEKVQLPIIMLTAKGQIVDKVVGLKLGADDYMEKPFEMIELLARIEVQLRKRKNDHYEAYPDQVSFGDVTVYFKKGEVLKGGEELTLSSKEFQLLCFLINHSGIILSRDQLLNEVWGYEAMPYTRTVDVHIAWLRQKLEDNPKKPRFITTVHGRGYKFQK